MVMTVGSAGLGDTPWSIVRDVGLALAGLSVVYGVVTACAFRIAGAGTGTPRTLVVKGGLVSAILYLLLGAVTMGVCSMPQVWSGGETAEWLEYLLGICTALSVFLPWIVAVKWVNYSWWRGMAAFVLVPVFMALLLLLACEFWDVEGLLTELDARLRALGY